MLWFYPYVSKFQFKNNQPEVRMSQKKKRIVVLCVCMGNTCRSPMMEAKLRKELLAHGMHHVKVESAGTSELCSGQPANEFSVKCMREEGLSLEKHVSRCIGNLNGLGYDLVIVAEPDMVRPAKETFPNAKVEVMNAANGGVSNPFNKGEDAYRECNRCIEASLPAVLQTIREM
jgi:protein-tyrosine-phosphatase